MSSSSSSSYVPLRLKYPAVVHSATRVKSHRVALQLGLAPCLGMPSHRLALLEVSGLSCVMGYFFMYGS